MLSCGSLNKNLKVIAKLCNIERKLIYHQRRHNHFVFSADYKWLTSTLIIVGTDKKRAIYVYLHRFTQYLKSDLSMGKGIKLVYLRLLIIVSVKRIKSVSIISNHS